MRSDACWDRVSFIWVALIGLWAYGIAIKPINVTGMVLLVAGMYLSGK